jgi:hypothetical protein
MTQANANDDTRRDASACNDQLGLVPKRDALTRLKRLHDLLAHGRCVDGYLGADALAAGIAEIERLRAALDRLLMSGDVRDAADAGALRQACTALGRGPNVRVQRAPTAREE